MKGFGFRFSIGLALACAAFPLSLAVCAQAQTVTILAQFSDTQGHGTAVIQATDGNFYGASGSDNGAGAIFRMTPAGELSTIYTFCSQPNCPDGQYLNAGPILGNDGNLYGIAPYGGNSTNSGTLYKLTLDGQLTIVHTFCSGTGCADGGAPNSVIQGADGNFYGTTSVGGAKNHGTFFQISPTGKFKVLHSFCSLPKCVDRGGNLIQGIDGNFYGINGAGTMGGGAFYQLTPAGTYTALYNFCFYTDVNCTTGSYPSAVVQDAAGNFFGTAQYGGRGNGSGTVFEITSKYELHVLHWFDLNHGNDPLFGVTLANDGNFYGMTNDSTNVGSGRLYEITPKGDYNVLYDFLSSGAYDPWSSPFQGTNGLLYGVTLYSNSPCCGGTVYSLDNGLPPLVKTLPHIGKVGQSVIVLGNGLTGSSSVTFNGVPANFTVESDTYIQATVPAGATSGTVSVITPSGTLNSNPQFVVMK